MASSSSRYGFDGVIENQLPDFLGKFPEFLECYEDKKQTSLEIAHYFTSLIAINLFDEHQRLASFWKSASIQQLDETETFLRGIVRYASPTVKDHNKRIVALQQLQLLSRSGIRYCQGLDVQPFGSFVSGLYTPHGDLDMTIEGTATMTRNHRNYTQSQTAFVAAENMERQDQQRFLHSLADRLLQRSHVTHLNRIIHARVPIIKYYDANAGVECDVAMGAVGGQFKSAVMGLLAHYDWRVGALVRLIKLWARHHQINDPSTGTLNSFALTLMVVFVLQTRTVPILPPLSSLFLMPGESEDDASKRPMHNGKHPDIQKLRVVGERLQHRIQTLNSNGRIYPHNNNNNIDTNNATTKNNTSPSSNEQNGVAGVKLEEATAKEEEEEKEINRETLLELLAAFFHLYRAMFNRLDEGSHDSPFKRIFRRMRIDTWRGRHTYAPWSEYDDSIYYFSIEDPFNSLDNCARTVREQSAIDSIRKALECGVRVVNLQHEWSYNEDDGSGKSSYFAMADCFGDEAAEMTDVLYKKNEKDADNDIVMGGVDDFIPSIPPTMLWPPNTLKHILPTATPTEPISVNHTTFSPERIRIMRLEQLHRQQQQLQKMFVPCVRCACIHGEAVCADDSRGDAPLLLSLATTETLNENTSNENTLNENTLNETVELVWPLLKSELEITRTKIRVEAQELERNELEKKKRKDARKKAKEDKRSARKEKKSRAKAAAAADAAGKKEKEKKGAAAGEVPPFVQVKINIIDGTATLTIIILVEPTTPAVKENEEENEEDMDDDDIENSSSSSSSDDEDDDGDDRQERQQQRSPYAGRSNMMTMHTSAVQRAPIFTNEGYSRGRGGRRGRGRGRNGGRRNANMQMIMDGFERISM